MIIDFKFFFKPSCSNYKKNDSFRDKCFTFLVCFVCMYVLVIGAGIFTFIVDIFIYKNHHIRIHNIIVGQQEKFMKLMSLNYLLFMMLLIPVFEELICRFPLTLKKWHVATSLAVVSLLYVGDYVYKFSVFSLYSWLKIIVIILIFVLFKFLKQEHFDIVRSKYFGLFFYVLALFFALIHINNFYKIIPNDLIWIAPLYVMPQFFLAFFSGYIRLKNGFLWSVLMHLLFNIPGVLSYVMKAYPNLL